MKLEELRAALRRGAFKVVKAERRRVLVTTHAIKPTKEVETGIYKIGPVELGPIDGPIKVCNVDEFERLFGDPSVDRDG